MNRYLKMFANLKDVQIVPDTFVKTVKRFANAFIFIGLPVQEILFRSLVFFSSQAN